MHFYLFSLLRAKRCTDGRLAERAAVLLISILCLSAAAFESPYSPLGVVQMYCSSPWNVVCSARRCTGKEDRLAACSLSADGWDTPAKDGTDGSPQAVPAESSDDQTHIYNSCVRKFERLAVTCRTFEIKGAPQSQLLS
jgi:hypothetical protein